MIYCVEVGGGSAGGRRGGGSAGGRSGGGSSGGHRSAKATVGASTGGRQGAGSAVNIRGAAEIAPHTDTMGANETEGSRAPRIGAGGESPEDDGPNP